MAEANLLKVKSFTPSSFRDSFEGVPKYDDRLRVTDFSKSVLSKLRGSSEMGIREGSELDAVDRCCTRNLFRIGVWGAVPNIVPVLDVSGLWVLRADTRGEPDPLVADRTPVYNDEVRGGIMGEVVGEGGSSCRTSDWESFTVGNAKELGAVLAF